MTIRIESDPPVANRQLKAGEVILMIRRDLLPNGYQEHVYIASSEKEANEYSDRILKINATKLESLLRDGHTIDQAIEQLSEWHPWQEQVFKERDELQEKYDKLGRVVRSLTFEALPSVDQNLLNRQYIHMAAYLGVLIERVNRFQRKNQ